MNYIGNLNTHAGKIGKLGENFAVEYLISKGHTILERNYRNKLGEIDIITILNNKIHIIEVKTSQSNKVRAEENMNFTKMRKVAKLGEIFSKGRIFCIDFIGIYLNNDFSLKNINYIENLEIY